MRYDSDHKAKTRERIETVASARFRREGIDAVGIASLMESAGLTHGGFYAHFKSKDALIAAAVALGFEQAAQRLRNGIARHPGRSKPVAFAKAYLNEHHRNEPDAGCVAAALGAEIGRCDETVRRVFTEQLDALIRSAMPDDGTPAERRDTALATVALSVGALLLARTVDDPALSKQLLTAGVKAVDRMAG
ncbi:TetR/AcrR family transcriptional regulator [Trinickia caryophylli]|uniref:Transcriptional regulator, TetR family n=1 Tax=Trinickia caryophylli TaxID=28094 RepID=A0A1X7FWJ7_TRICW|nr:TetR/AcrR family transcriptional regulator [Trinickia caryophylli]PMS11770.1 TetR/AcrR family transcriptional regulator [Trinickia caryophylli]TRX17449.1 TetR/AcrR family transcriptional regulator [Trinickia caryophylli]WQE11806.1 TetR/AcrR family transcriptional regulator [Trinickia caryophylli]SMF59953.1 transcriptional regulator, TetR family [Trinickia caryophylli]GLU34694.1 TetR family transcriptional regulator [Trinickia caryophylli]